MVLPQSPRVRQAVAVSAIASTCVFLVSPFARADDSLTSQQQQLQQGMSKAQSAIGEDNAALAAANAALQAAQAQLAAANAKLADIQKQLADAQANMLKLQAQLAQSKAALAAAQTALAAATARVVAQREEIGRMAAASYQHGSASLMFVEAVMRAGSPQDVASQLNAMHSLQESNSAKLDHLRQLEAQMDQEATAVAAATASIQQATDEATQTVARIQGLQADAAKQQASIAALVAQRASAQQTADAARAHDQQVLQTLQAQEQQVELAIQARARADANRSFAGNGMLQRPVPDEVTSPFGYRVNPVEGYYGLHNGVDFKASCGEPQVAAETGTVISEYFSEAWGNRLYIDLGNINGHNYTVIYNHLSGYAVGVGDRVSRGQVVARTGTTGWSTGCHLHFTVLRDGQAVDPMPYF